MACYLCKNENSDMIFDYHAMDKYERAVAEEQPGYYRKWARCTNCGLIYSTSNFSAPIDGIYSGKYRSKEFRGEDPEDSFNKIMGLPKEQSENHYRANYVKNGYTGLKSNLFGAIKKQKKILDVGFGFCVFLGGFLGEGWEGYGIDPDPRCCEFAKNRLKIRVFNGLYKKNAFNERFDLITINHVLEHIKDPINFLRDIRGDLEDDGLVYIEVPDAIEFNLLGKDHDEFNSCHYYMFSPSTLTKALAGAGFIPLSIKRIATPRNYRRIMLFAAKNDGDKYDTG